MARLLPCLVSVALLTTPALAAKPNAHEGAALFAEKGCAHCHGANGIGGNLGPDLAKVRERLNARQIAEQIRHGGQAMPPFGDVLSSDEIAGLVAYLRSRRKPEKPVATPPFAPPSAHAVPATSTP